MDGSRVTVREIARLAGVSVATVSRVSNGTGQVSEEMRRRVLAAIDKYGYRPDHLGRALAARRHGAVGLVFPGLSGAYFAELIQGFESEAVPAGISVHILSTHLRDDSDAQVVEMSRRVDGMVVLGGTVSDEAVARVGENLPVVILAGTAANTVASVRVVNDRAMAQLTRHLLVDHGLRDLAFVGDPDASPDVAERWAGFRAAHRELGLPEPAPPVRHGLQQPDGVRAADQLLRCRPVPAAMVCANDETALGALMTVLGRGLRVPQDIAITGFDGVPMSELVSPSLTTVRQPLRRLGAEAARQVLAAAEGRGPGGLRPVEVLLDTELVVRASCGCPV